MVRDAGVWVDDDNDPVPENIPSPIIEDEEAPIPKVLGDKFGHDGICFQRTSGAQNTKAKVSGGNLALSRVQVFELFLPKEYIESILIPETNTKIEGPPLLYGEFLQWIGLQLMMATI